MNFEAQKNEQEFEKKKKEYFSKLALGVKSALELHKMEGLWEQKNGKRDWGNVSEHCLVEVARAEIFAEKLNLSQEIKKKLILAAAMHDFFKKSEVEAFDKYGATRETIKRLNDEKKEKTKNLGIDETIKSISESVADDSLKEMERILQKKEPSEKETASLVMHYIDDYTINADWVNKSEKNEGFIKNDLDRRIDKNESNPRYRQINEDGKLFFNGETAYQAQRRIGHMVEKRIAKLIELKSGEKIDPLKLPEIIDMEIKNKIDKYE